VCPVYNEADGIDEFHRRLQQVRASLAMTSDVIYVDDGSNDGSLDMLRQFHDDDPSVRVLSFSRNFGHQVAISAGLENAHGMAAITLDTDLQDPPEVIPALVEKWQAGAQVVSAVRKVRRGEPRWRLRAIRSFYRTVRRMTDLDIKFDSGDYRLMDRKVLDIIKEMPERDRFVRGMAAWVGFDQDTVEYERDPRFAGQSKYPLRKLVRLAAAAVTSFSLVPLQLAGAIGFVIAIVCLLAVPFVIAARLLGVTGLGGQTTVLIGMMFLGGVQLMFLGVIGEYLGRTYHETKQRPLYLVKLDTSDQPTGLDAASQRPPAESPEPVLGVADLAGRSTAGSRRGSSAAS
jgi:dolichol-phosphate mannosyltransferase